MLPKAQRLRQASEIRLAFQAGRGFADGPAGLIVAHVWAKASGPVARAGFAVGKKVGKAVVRNRVKRRLRAAVAALRPRLAGQPWLMVVAKPPAAGASYLELQAALERALGKAGVLRPVGGAA